MKTIDVDLGSSRNTSITKNIETLDMDIFLTGSKPIQKFNNRIYMNSKIDAVIQRNQLYKQISPYSNNNTL